MAATASAYQYNGYKWSYNPTIKKDSTIPSSWSSAISSATSAWNNAGAKFTFYLGQTAVNNKLIYGPMSPTSTLGLTTPNANNGYFSSCITTFNSNDPWSTASNGETGKYDVQSCVTHELGHWLSLDHSSDTQATMYYSMAANEIKKRSLESDDISGIKSIYGTKSSLASSDYSTTGIKMTDNSITSINTEKPLDIHLDALIKKCTHNDLKDESDMIVIGTVKEILPSKWNTIDGEKPNKENTKQDQNIIYTDIIVNVGNYLKNPISSKEVIVRTYGGKVGNVSMELDVEAQFKPGENVLLYLSKDTSPLTNIGPEHFFVYGSMQGKFKLTDDGKAVRPDEIVSQDELLK
jgi:hypothetical protein